ncbi:MAG TPA: hypothetical protein VL382_06370 [Terriglobales bacterium]|nr:hypothetical protein [Terriglobales bacterium]
MRQLTRRNVFPLALVLLALAVHGPLLLSGLPGATYDGNTHMFFAAHYARDWFQPWNEQWYGGFSQTTYPPLAHQWIALLSFAAGIPAAYLLVQLVALLLIPIGVLRYARLWVEERAARYAAVGSIFLGSLALLVYQAGQLPMTVAAALLLNALPFVHQWVREGKKSDLWKGLALLSATAAAHHVTMLFGIPLFAAPVLWQAIGGDRRRALRALTVVLVAAAGMALVVLPFLLSPQVATSQAPIPHASRANYLLGARTGVNFWIIPMGALLLALPFALWRGARRAALRPLLCGWSLTLLLGLGGTTMVAPVLLGDLPRALTGVDLFQVLTFERFTFWATLMMLPIVGSLVLDLGERFRWPALAGAGLAALLTCGVAVGWAARRVMVNPAFDVQDVVSFLAQPEHARYRYLTLGFGNEFPLVARQVSANAIDGDYNSARLLPELTASGAGSLDKAKYFAGGLPALRQVLARANDYGLKYVFVHDRYYEPLLSFSGWHRVDSYDGGSVTVWEKDGVPPAKPLHLASVPRWQGIAWGTLPLFSSLLALGLIVGLRERRRDEDVIPVRSEAAAAA